MCKRSNSNDGISKKERMQIKKYKEYSTNGIDTEYIFSIYYIAYQYGMLKSRTDILGAILLKWVIDGKITIEGNKIGGLIAEYGEFPLLYEGCKIEDILNKSFENELEKELYYRIDDIELNPAYINSGLSVYSISITIDSKELKKYKKHSEIIKALSTLEYIYYVEEIR